MAPRFPVTNELFASFLKATSYVPAPVLKSPRRFMVEGDAGNFLKHWNCSQPCVMPPGIAKQPVVFVSHWDAEQYCCSQQGFLASKAAKAGIMESACRGSGSGNMSPKLVIPSGAIPGAVGGGLKPCQSHSATPASSD